MYIDPGLHSFIARLAALFSFIKCDENLVGIRFNL